MQTSHALTSVLIQAELSMQAEVARLQAAQALATQMQEQVQQELALLELNRRQALAKAKEHAEACARVEAQAVVDHETGAGTHRRVSTILFESARK